MIQTKLIESSRIPGRIQLYESLVIEGGAILFVGRGPSKSAALRAVLRQKIFLPALDHNLDPDKLLNYLSS